MYVTYEDVYAEPYTDFKNVKTINIPKTDINNISQKLSDYIDDDFLGKLVKIDFSDVHQDNNLWLSIYDKNGRCFEQLNSNIFSTLSLLFSSLAPGAQMKQTNNPIIFNYVDIDFERSEILNISQNNYTLTFYFV